MTKQLMAAAVVSVVALLTSVGATAAAAWRTFEVPTGGFSLSMPASWTGVTADQLQMTVSGNSAEAKAVRATIESGVMKLFVSDSASGAKSSYMNAGAERIGKLSLEKFAGAGLADLKKASTTDGPVAFSHVKLPAGPAIMLDWKTKQKGQPELETLAYFFVRAEVAYELSYTAPATRIETVRPIFTRSAQSFRYLPPPDLGGFVLKGKQLGTGYLTKLIADGDSFIGTTTLDICTGPFPSELLRTGRIQNNYTRKGSHVTVSNEIVTYVEGGAQQALAEAKTSAANCIAKPQVTKRGANHATLTITQIHLPKVLAGTLAVKINIVGVQNKKPIYETVIAVYQVHGNVLSGVYVSADKASAASKVLALAKSAAAKSAVNLGVTALVA